MSAIMDGVAMTKAPLFRGKVEKGRLVLDRREQFKALIESLEGQKIEIVLRERRAARSDQANRYYHGVVVSMIGEYLGYDKVECHEVLKEKFGIKSTTTLNAKEFQEYITKVVRFAASEFGLNIPDPDSVEY